MGLSRQITPPGGWAYTIGNYQIKSDTWTDLVSDVTSHLKSNKIEVGNVEQDIEDQLLGLHPSLKIDLIKLKSNGR